NAFADQVGVAERAERFCHGASQASGASDAFRFRSFCHACVKRASSPAAPARAGFHDTILDPAFARVTPNPQISFAIATAVSAIRFEKPHSLSYQESTRTNLPSITLV